MVFTHATAIQISLLRVPQAIPRHYQAASLYLYKQLSGDTNANFQPPSGARTYFTFKSQMLDGPTDSNGNLTSVTNIKIRSERATAIPRCMLTTLTGKTI